MFARLSIVFLFLPKACLREAGIATGRTGHRVASYVENSLNVTAPEAFDDILRQSSDDQTLQQVYTWSALG